MHSKQFYPSYIPSQWIHYTRHKKKRIRKKYQNRIRREVRRHKVDAQTLSFLLADASSRQTSVWEWCSSPPFLSFPQIKDVCNREAQQPALVGGSWRGNYALPLFSLSLPQIAIPPLPRLALPQITAPELESPAIEIPEIPETTQDALEKLGKALAELGEQLAEVFRPVVEYVTKAIKKLFKWAGDFWDHLWCENKHWWYMAEHHKKRRIRKKYRNKIRREARRRAGELLEILTADDSEDDETASDDEEGP